MDQSKRAINRLAIHVLAYALNQFLENNVTLTNFSCDENGFSVEFDTLKTITSNDFEKIKKIAKKFIKNNEKITIIKPIKLNQYLDFLYHKHVEQYQFIQIGEYSNLSFLNLSEQLKDIKVFELISLGGSYWLNNNKNPQFLKIHGIAFDSKEHYDAYLLQVAENKKKDHRKIGSDLEIFTLSKEVAHGMPIWLPNGQTIKKAIKDFLFETFNKYHFQFVDTPVLGNKELYIKSGHWQHYKENNYPPFQIDNETFMLRPMTCPHHLSIYNLKPRTYKELPFYICEDSKLFRYEKSGGLFGLERVRAMELFDCHIVAKKDQIKEIILFLEKILQKIHKKLGLQITQVDLSLKDDDKEKYYDDPFMWHEAQMQLKDVLKQFQYPVIEKKGEAAFYGPKIDYQVKNILNKIITVSTIQLDFLLPKRFEIKYFDQENNKNDCVLIHFGPIGTYERIIATLLTQTMGHLPLWLAPKQVVIIPVNWQIHSEYCQKIQKELVKHKIRSQIDDSDERFNKKIRNAQVNKIPYQVIIGDNEVSEQKITYKSRLNNKNTTISLNQFIKHLCDEINN